MSSSPTDAANAPLPTPRPLEVASGVALGARLGPPPGRLPPIAGGPREVLEAILAEALESGPCHVLFSGGRDSSAMLALAAGVARDRGLPLPVALTARFALHPRTWESDWQERTVSHLRLDDWVRFEVTDELDGLGAIATDLLRRHGAFWPPNAHTMSVFAAKASGGTVLTGGGGDELFSPWGWRRPAPAHLRRIRPRRRAAKWAAFSALPLGVRQAVLVRRVSFDLPWLTPAARRVLREQYRREPQSRTWQGEVRRFLDGRYFEVVRETLHVFAAEQGARLIEPFYDPRFAEALATLAPTGFTDRGTALERLFGDLLPSDVLHRSTKATFTEALWGARSRAFIDDWDGTGVDRRLVDVEGLRAAWAPEVPDGRTAGLLHAAWLAAQASATTSSS